jgi:hypothetical protein
MRRSAVSMSSTAGIRRRQNSAWSLRSKLTSGGSSRLISLASGPSGRGSRSRSVASWCAAAPAAIRWASGADD